MNNPFTTAASGGVITRYIIAMAGAALTVIGFLGWLDVSQTEALKANIPAFAEAVGVIVMVGMTTYAAITKSSSDKAKAVSVAVDKGVADGDLTKSAPVVIQTPQGTPDIVVQPPK